MTRKMLAAIAPVFLFMSGPALAQSSLLTNDSVVSMLDAGLGDDVVIAKIKASPVKFDLTTDDLIALKKKGVSSAVLTAMLNASTSGAVSSSAAMVADSPDPSVPHPSGVYIFDDWQQPAKMIDINPTTSNQTKTGGILGYALTGGIASLSMKSVIPGDHARVIAQTAKPVFYFYFDRSNQSLSTGASGSIFSAGGASTVTSPSEFSLVRFDEKKGRREVRTGSFNLGGAKTGVMDKYRIDFDFDQVRPGVFRVSPKAALRPGEYGFVYSLATGPGVGVTGASMMARVFDFGIAPAPAAVN